MIQGKYIEKIPDLAWFLIRTMPKSEQNAEMYLKINNIPCYLPRYNRIYINSFTGKNGRKYAYKRPPVLTPMFPGYIFAALNVDSMSMARRHRCIAQICLHTNYTEEELLKDLRKVQDFEFLARENEIEIREDIQVKTPVLIKRGYFKNWEGIVEKRLDKNFVFIRINTLGCSVGVECAVVDCEVIS